MLIRHLFRTFILFLLFTSCSKSSSQISITCEDNQVGKNIIVWETTPIKEGIVRVFAGNSPYNIVEDTPIAMANIGDQRLVIINNNPSVRNFYKVVFNNEERIVVGSRNINIPNVQNFRDLGGYPIHSTKKRTKWGMVYRTGNLDNIDAKGIARLKNLNIKTVIDLRPLNEQKQNQLLDNNFKTISIPVSCRDTEDLINQIGNKEITRKELRAYMQCIYTQLTKENNEQYKQIFDLLLDKANYPIVYQCAAGKRQSGIVSYILLSILNVNEDIIKTDYKRSNNFIDISEAYVYASNLSNNAQEALTALLLTQDEYLDAAIQEVKSSYGNIDSFMTEGLGFTDNDLKKLQSMLLE